MIWEMRNELVYLHTISLELVGPPSIFICFLSGETNDDSNHSYRRLVNGPIAQLVRAPDS